MVTIIYKTPTGQNMYWACSEDLLEKYLQQCEDKGLQVVDWKYF